MKEHKSEAVLLAGAVLVAVGVAMIYVPAGVITAGLLAGAWAVLDMMGGDDK